MKKVFWILILTMLACGSLGQNFNYFDTSFYSPLLDTTKDMRIYLPPGYELDTCSYPVVYYLHGATGTYQEVLGILPEIQDMIDTGYINPVLIVGLDGQCDPFEGSMYTNSVLYGNYEDYIIQDAIPFAESILRTKSGTDYRSIMGFAMGGYGTMKMAFKHKDMFAGAASYNGPLQLDTLFQLWRPEVLGENTGPPYQYVYGAGVFTILMFTGAGGFSPNLSLLPYQVEFPYDQDGYFVDSVMQKWKMHCCCRLAKDIDPTEYYPGLFLACGINDFLYFHPGNVCFADTLEYLGLDHEFLTTNDGHVISDEILIAGMYFLDSVMHDSIMTGTINPVAINQQEYRTYPNPFTQSTTFSFTITEPSRVLIQIFNSQGQFIEQKELMKPAGKHKVHWSAIGLSPGLYYYKMLIGSQALSGKMVLMR